MSGLADPADPRIDLRNRNVKREFDGRRVRGPLVVVTPVGVADNGWGPGSWPSMSVQIAMHRPSQVGLACWSPVRFPERKVSLLLPLWRGAWLMAIEEVRL